MGFLGLILGRAQIASDLCLVLPEGPVDSFKLYTCELWFVIC